MRSALVSRLLSAAARSYGDSREQFAMRLEAVTLARGAAPVPAALLLGVNLASAVLVITYVCFSGLLLALIPAAARAGWGSAAGRDVAGYLAAVGAGFLATQLLSPVKVRLAGLVTRQVDGVIRDRIAAASARIPGLAPFEDQALIRELSIARDGLDSGSHTPGEAVAGIAALAGMYAQSLLAAALIAVLLSPIVAIGLLAGGLVIRRAHRIGLVLQVRGRARNWDLDREAGYYRRVALDGAAGREIRVFGLARWLRGRYRSRSVQAIEASLAVTRRVNGIRFAIPVAAATAAAVASLAWIAAHASGGVPIRALVISLQAGYLTLQIGNFFVQEDWGTQFGLFGYEALKKFEAGTAAFIQNGPGILPRPSPAVAGLPRRELRFDAVSFHYPGTDRLVLDDLTLAVPAGQSLAIVGLNGAGKTTLVKLMAGLYTPASGAILADGTDLRELPLAAWQRNVAAIFQDFERYQLTAAENIAFGDAADQARAGDIRWAAERAGILDVLEALPRGLDTRLAPGYADGTDLSGGQWQRVALARAFYALRAGAGILILDEPTASLDVRGEAEFLDQFMELTRGVTTVVISHRFATVRNAGQIVVLDGGRITERGTHDELLASGGRYADLFRIQAERFADADADAQTAPPRALAPEGAE